MKKTTKRTIRTDGSGRKRASKTLGFHILTIFPGMFSSYLGESLFARAKESGIITVALHDLRDFTEDRHNKVDDRPFGGGPGMVLKIQPIWAAFRAVMRGITKKRTRKPRVRTILFSARGEAFDAHTARRLAKYDHLVLVCGRYEGVDERVAEHIADEEISIGNYVLSGGEIPALVLMEAVSRHVPGFIGKEESLEEVNGSFPTYTRPESFAPDPKKRSRWKVPPVLLSGNHKKISEWRESHRGRTL